MSELDEYHMNPLGNGESLFSPEWLIILVLAMLVFTILVVLYTLWKNRRGKTELENELDHARRKQKT